MIDWVKGLGEIKERCCYKFVFISFFSDELCCVHYCNYCRSFFLETILMFTVKAINIQIIVDLISHKGFNYFRQTGGNWYWSIIIRFFKVTFFWKTVLYGFFRHLGKWDSFMQLSTMSLSWWVTLRLASLWDHAGIRDGPRGLYLPSDFIAFFFGDKSIRKCFPSIAFLLWKSSLWPGKFT